jgi:hypothetical protein
MAKVIENTKSTSGSKLERYARKHTRTLKKCSSSLSKNNGSIKFSGSDPLYSTEKFKLIYTWSKGRAILSIIRYFTAQQQVSSVV